jgi:acyl dehydratase
VLQNPDGAGRGEATEGEMLYFEDLAIGQRFRSPALCVTAGAIKAFAGEFDPQPFHLDEDAARGSIFEGLAASGWHTAALTMRLCVASDFNPAGGIIGVGGELTWLKPVRPDDELRVEIEIVETRESRSRPRQGIVKLRITTFNQRSEAVQSFAPTLFVDRRPGQPVALVGEFEKPGSV